MKVMRVRTWAGGRLRVVPAVVWLIVGLHLAVTLAQTAIWPNNRAPDELLHVDLIVQVHEGTAWPWPDPGELQLTRGTRAGTFMQSGRLPGRQHLADGPRSVPPRGERPTYVSGGGTATTEHSDGRPTPVNQLVQHPPLYYVLGAGVLHLVPDWEHQPFDRVWLILRLWNALLVAALPLFMWAIARRLALPEPLPVAAALVPLAIPEMTHLDAAVNNDNLIVILAAAATYLVARVLTGDLSRRTALVVGVLVSSMMLTKGFGLMMPAFVGLAYAVAGFRHRHKAAAAGALVLAGLASAPGALWWIRNLVVYGRVQPAGNVVEQPESTARYGWEDGGADWLAQFADRMVTTFFVADHAALQRHDASWWASRVGLALIVVGVAVTLVRRTLPRWDVLVLAVPVVALAAIVAKGSWDAFASYHAIGVAQQGRYLYAGAPALMVVALAGAAVLRPAVRRWVPLGLLGLAGGMHVAFQYDTWWLYWVPRGGTSVDQLSSAAEAIAYMYPLPPWVLVLLLGVATALTAAVLSMLVRTAWRTRP